MLKLQNTRGTPPTLVGLWTKEDVTDRLGELQFPVLLLWGDADPISPVAVGRRLADLFPRAELVVIKNGTHDLVSDRANEIIPYIEKHLDL